jgi:chlorophyll(ide) b reductase
MKAAKFITGTSHIRLRTSPTPAIGGPFGTRAQQNNHKNHPHSNPSSSSMHKSPPAPSPPPRIRRTRNKALPFIYERRRGQYDGLHKPLGLIASSALTFYTAVQLSTTTGIQEQYNPASIGAALGGTFTLLNLYSLFFLWRTPPRPLNVVITGGSRGVGKALAREHLLVYKDNVIITGRDKKAVERAVSELQDEISEQFPESSSSRGNNSPSSSPRPRVVGLSQLDICNPSDVLTLVNQSRELYNDVIDVWINNAGVSGGYKMFAEQTPEQLESVVKTNLIGPMLCTHALMTTASNDVKSHGDGENSNHNHHHHHKVHVFNMDGAGVDGLATPNYAAYGSTKAGLGQLFKTLTREFNQHRHHHIGSDDSYEANSTKVLLSMLSPGMVLTDLLLQGATPSLLSLVFNTLCEQPETVAAFLVPRVRSVVAQGQGGAYIRYLTPLRVVAKLSMAGFNRNRFFDGDGNTLYPGEKERLRRDALQMERKAKRAAKRSSGLAVAYALSIAAGYLIFVTDALAVHMGR